MNVIAAPPMTVEQFLEWEDRQDQRYEFDGVRPIAMNGGTRAHNFITGNVFEQLRSALRGGQWHVYMAGMKVRLGDRVRYPDVMVAPATTAMSEIVEMAPIVVVEVLSPSTASIDRVVKLAEYRSCVSIRRYVMLEQTRMAASVIAAVPAAGGGEVWAHDLVIGADGRLDMPEIGAGLRLGALYEGVLFPEADAED